MEPLADASSFESWRKRLEAGDSVAEAKVFERYASDLHRLAHHCLDRRIRNLVEPDDVLQSALRSFFRGQTAGQYSLESWGSLWGLISQIVIHKCWAQNERFLSQGRDVRRQVRLDGEPTSREPTPAEAAQAADLVELALRHEAEEDRQILVYLLQGYSLEEIGLMADCTRAKIRRVRDRARRRLERVLAM